ncbi:MAG: zinc-dependent metalloprotease [Actinomycetota bacterium]
MSDQTPGMGDVFSEMPLFREIQRVLLSSSGPVNWELARQMGIAMASWGKDDPPPTDEDERTLQEAVRSAELQVAEFTQLSPPSDVAPVKAMRRAQWVEANIETLKEFVEPAAAKVGQAFDAVVTNEAEEPAQPDQTGMLAKISPLLVGTQVGAVLGSLGQSVLGQYDIALPRPVPGSLFFVVPNIAAFERDWSLSQTDFREWVALHEVTHRFEFSRPWARSHFLELLRDFLSTLEVDVRALQEQIERLDITNAQDLQSVLGSEQGVFGVVLDDEQRIKLNRIQAFMAAAEGYADHVMHALGRKLLSSFSQIEEAMRRYRETESGDPVFERLLGIEMKKEQYRLGRTFSDLVADQTDEATLARVWDTPETLPSMPEILEPRLWMSRVA